MEKRSAAILIPDRIQPGELYLLWHDENGHHQGGGGKARCLPAALAGNFADAVCGSAVPRIEKPAAGDASETVGTTPNLYRGLVCRVFACDSLCWLSGVYAGVYDDRHDCVQFLCVGKNPERDASCEISRDLSGIFRCLYGCDGFRFQEIAFCESAGMAAVLRGG